MVSVLWCQESGARTHTWSDCHRDPHEGGVLPHGPLAQSPTELARFQALCNLQSYGSTTILRPIEGTQAMLMHSSGYQDAAGGQSMVLARSRRSSDP